MKERRIIISGGGTGGHIFPAIAIANAIKSKYPDAKILFVGAKGRMEMEKVPAAGYEIVGLPIMGFNRSEPFKNITVVWKLCVSMLKALSILSKFRPDVAIGVGGYASGPLLRAASFKGIPIVIQEQNSFPGVTNKMLAAKAEYIFVAYDKLEKYFPVDKIKLTGNPVRQGLKSENVDCEAAYKFFKLNPNKRTLLVVGGSLGARTINEAILGQVDHIVRSDIQVIWQTGSFYYDKIYRKVEEYGECNLVVTPFVSRMDWAYLVADLVISRAGASSISELCLLGKPTILVPSPNVAEDHQTKNAMSLVEKEAAILVRDADARKSLVQIALETILDFSQLEKLSTNISKLGIPDSADQIVSYLRKFLN